MIPDDLPLDLEPQKNEYSLRVIDAFKKIPEAEDKLKAKQEALEGACFYAGFDLKNQDPEKNISFDEQTETIKEIAEWSLKQPEEDQISEGALGVLFTTLSVSRGKPSRPLKPDDLRYRPFAGVVRRNKHGNIIRNTKSFRR